MNDSNAWTVDRLAAQNLLADLKLDATAETLEAVAEHFAKHRRSAHEWAANRAHSHVIQTLEATSLTPAAQKSAEWRDGFCFAEQQIFSMMPEELLELGPERTRSKGQILRSLVRQARTTEQEPHS